MKLSKRNINFCSILFIGACLFMSCADFAADDRKSVQLVLKKEGKVYLFSGMGSFITKGRLDKNESPPMAAPTRLVIKDDQLFMEPQQLKNVVNIISGNYVIHDYEEKSIDGYVTKGEHDVYDKKYSSEPTEKIGKMNEMANIYLRDIELTKEHHISWQRSPDQRPLKNCIEMALWVDKSYKPGETTAAREQFIMINLNDVLAFYNSKATLEYVEEDGLLYIIVE